MTAILQDPPSGGRYLRNPDGTLTPVQQTAPAQGRAQRTQETPESQDPAADPVSAGTDHAQE